MEGTPDIDAIKPCIQDQGLPLVGVGCLGPDAERVGCLVIEVFELNRVFVGSEPRFREDALSFIDVSVEARLDSGVRRLTDALGLGSLDAGAEENTGQVVSRDSGEAGALEINPSFSSSFLMCSSR